MSSTPKLRGRYATPLFHDGVVVVCLARGDCEITALPDTPMPWPIGRSLVTRRPALVLDDGLAEAVRRESGAAICHFWGVGMFTVWK